MKLFKKIFSMVVAVVIALSVSVCVVADESFNLATSASNANLVIGTVNYTGGGNVTVPVTLKNNPGIYAINLQIKFSDKLSFVSVGVDSSMSEAVTLEKSTSSNGVLTFLIESKNTSTVKNFTKNGTLLNMVFTPKSYAVGASYNIEFTEIDRKCVVNDQVVDITDSLTYFNGAVKCVAPATPTVKSVAYSAKNQVKITWGSVANATGYIVYRNGVQIASLGKVTSYVDAKATAAGTYSYQVVAKNGSVLSAKSVAKSIKTMNFKAKATVKNKVGKKQVKITLKKKVANADGYQFQVSLKKKMKNPKSATGKTSATIKKLKSKKVYYTRARAYKLINGKKVYGAWSKVVKTAKTK